MTDYHPLIARAVEGLDRSTGEARCALYEQARHALVAQLRSNQPALLEADITKERLALEEAIRKVEAEAVRKSRSEPRAERRPRAGWTAVLPSARERLLRGWSSLKKQGIKGFRNVVGEVHDLGAATAKTAQTARQIREAYEPEAPQYPPATEEPASGAHRFRPHLEAEDLNSVDYDTRQRDLEPAYEPEDEPPPVQASPTRYTSRSAAASAEEEHEGKRRPFSYGGLARLVVVLIILAGVVAAISWQWSATTGLYHQYLSHIESKPQTQQAGHETTFDDRDVFVGPVLPMSNEPNKIATASREPQAKNNDAASQADTAVTGSIENLVSRENKPVITRPPKPLTPPAVGQSLANQPKPAAQAAAADPLWPPHATADPSKGAGQSGAVDVTVVTPPVSGGGYAVQVSSERSESRAQAAFRALQAQHPNQLGGRRSIIRRADLGAGTYHRTLVGPFASADKAARFCSGLKAAGGSCIIQKN
jgi:SPOR domain